MQQNSQNSTNLSAHQATQFSPDVYRLGIYMEMALEYIVYVAQNYGLVMVIMIAIIEVILWLVKKPIKLLTNKIPNENLRKLANKIFILMSFGLAFGLYALGHYILPNLVIWETGKVIACGAFAVVVYAFGDGVIPKALKAKDVNNIANAIAEVADIKEASGDDSKTVAEKTKSAVDAFNELCKATEKDSNK